MLSAVLLEAWTDPSERDGWEWEGGVGGREWRVVVVMVAVVCVGGSIYSNLQFFDNNYCERIVGLVVEDVLRVCFSLSLQSFHLYLRQKNKQTKKFTKLHLSVNADSGGVVVHP